MVADVGDSADPAVTRPAQQYLRPASLNAAHAGVRKLALLQNGGKLVGPAPLEDVAVYSEPVTVGELPTQVGPQPNERVPSQEHQPPAVPAASRPQDERGYAQVESGCVQEGVGYPHPARATPQVPPVRETGYCRSETADNPHRERRVGCVAHRPRASRGVEPVEDQGCGPRPHGYVREGRV